MKQWSPHHFTWRVYGMLFSVSLSLLVSRTPQSPQDCTGCSLSVSFAGSSSSPWPLSTRVGQSSGFWPFLSPHPFPMCSDPRLLLYIPRYISSTPKWSISSPDLGSELQSPIPLLIQNPSLDFSNKQLRLCMSKPETWFPATPILVWIPPKQTLKQGLRPVATLGSQGDGEIVCKDVLNILPFLCACSVTWTSLPWRSGISFTLWIWPGVMTCFDQKSA